MAIPKSRDRRTVGLPPRRDWLKDLIEALNLAFTKSDKGCGSGPTTADESHREENYAARVFKGEPIKRTMPLWQALQAQAISALKF